MTDFNFQVIIYATESFSGKLATAKTACQRVYQTAVGRQKLAGTTSTSKCLQIRSKADPFDSEIGDQTAYPVTPAIPLADVTGYRKIMKKEAASKNI